MAEANGAGGTTQPQDGQAGPRLQIIGQFIRDLSFENVAAQSGTKGQATPEINVQVGLDARNRTEANQFDVIIKLTINARAKETGEPIFVIEMEYAGIFLLENIPQEQLHPFLLIECPRQIFPFARRIVSDLTHDGGYPPLNLDNIDFLALYRQQIAQQQAAAAGQSGGTPGASA